MKTRRNMRCYRCGSVTNRGLHETQEVCSRCGATLREMPRRRFGQRTFKATPTPETTP